MPDFFRDAPGRLFLVAALLPLAPALLMLVAGTVRNLAYPARPPGKLGGYAVLVTMLASAALAVTGLVTFLNHPDAAWAERADWVRVGGTRGSGPATAFQLGYRVDRLTALMSAMVAVVGSLIVLFSLGYMADEAKPELDDHEAHVRRRGRFGRFFLYLALFAAAMLNLLLADNLFQIFVCWELVGVCSFFLIGFYGERPSAAAAANKAFLMNRVGDAGFLVGIAIAWAAFGTLNVEELTAKFAGGRPAELSDALWLVMGLGVFLGCVGKSAQFPLHTWLPDAMEGPTPVSALIHAATMVAAGVYLVGRAYPLFSPTVLLVIAGTGAITLLLAASIATVMTDVKRVLAYSTVSQLGFMMLALGVGGWAAGLFHLLTHAFFKALLFLSAGSVIHGLHHRQDVRSMGGLRRKMPVTAACMAVGVLAIVGTPLFSGWYSKDAIIAAALGAAAATQRQGWEAAVLLTGALLTAYYMTRLWLLVFTGEPRDRDAFDHAHESPWVMTVPLIVLSLFSVAVGWGWPVWDAGASALLHQLEAAAPDTAVIDPTVVKRRAEAYHTLAAVLALTVSAIGAGVAYLKFGRRSRTAAELDPPTSDVGAVLANKWYFDELYAALFVRPTVRAAADTAAVDKRPGPTAAEDGRVDAATVDGLFNAVGQLAGGLGDRLRAAQTGRVRAYVLVLALTVVGTLGMLVALIRP